MQVQAANKTPKVQVHTSLIQFIHLAKAEVQVGPIWLNLKASHKFTCMCSLFLTLAEVLRAVEALERRKEELGRERREAQALLARVAGGAAREGKQEERKWG